jgi:hypothetical protein
MYLYFPVKQPGFSRSLRSLRMTRNQYLTYSNNKMSAKTTMLKKIVIIINAEKWGKSDYRIECRYGDSETFPHCIRLRECT